MKKKIFAAFILAINIVSGMFAQEIQRLTFMEKDPGGTMRTVTVNAVFAGYQMNSLRLEGNLLVTRQRFFLKDDNQWSDWGIAEREPARISLPEIYDGLHAVYRRYPRLAARVNLGDGVQSVNIADIPIGRSSPIWWGEDGRSIYIHRQVWVIVR